MTNLRRANHFAIQQQMRTALLQAEASRAIANARADLERNISAVTAPLNFITSPKADVGRYITNVHLRLQSE